MMARNTQRYLIICIAACSIMYIVLNLDNITNKEKKNIPSPKLAILSTQLKVSSSISKQKLDFALLLRMHAPKGSLYETIFVQSMKYFFTIEAPLVVVLDKNTADTAFGKEIQQKYPFPKIYHEEPFDSQYYHGDGHTLQQLSTFYAEKYIDEKYVGFVDSDTMFVTMVTPDQLFIDDKPVIIGMFGRAQNSHWSMVAKVTEAMLGKKEVFRCMSYFPVMVMVKHLPEMRDYMAKLHNMKFEEVFQKFAGGRIVNFNIMCNYLWYFHRDEYTFHAQLIPTNGEWNGERNSPGRQGPAYYKENVPEAMRYPVARATVHYRYIKGWTKPKTFKTIMKYGLCHSGGFQLCPEMCNPIDKDKVVEDLFAFEYNDWRWNKRCIDAQRKHLENIKLLNETKIKNRILLGCKDVENLQWNL